MASTDAIMYRSWSTKGAGDVSAADRNEVRDDWHCRSDEVLTRTWPHCQPTVSVNSGAARMGATTLCLDMRVMTMREAPELRDCVLKPACLGTWSSSGAPSPPIVPEAARLQELARCTPPQALRRVDAEKITSPRELAKRRLQDRKLRTHI